MGLSNVKTVKKIICQGDPWGSIECSLMIDGFGKASLAEWIEPYRYKGTVPVPLLGMVDDILAISESGYKTSRLNSFINAQTAVKRLQFGPDKCHAMHIGKHIPNHKKINLYVDGWQSQEVESENTYTTESNEAFDGEHDMEESSSEKYLGANNKQ